VSWPDPPTISPPGPAVPTPRPDHAWPAVIAGLAVVALLAGALVVVGRGTGSSIGATAEPTTSAPATSSTTAPATTPGPGGPTAGGTGVTAVDAQLAEISRFVERQRGLQFAQPVKVDLVDDAEFQRRLLTDFDKDTGELVTSGKLLQALGLVPPNSDVVAQMRSLLGVGVLGFYDPTTKELVVRGTDLTPMTRQTVAHELTHALDDQHFGLDRPEYDQRDDEISFGFSALGEGDARRVENAYAASLSSADRAELRREESAVGGGAQLGQVPEALIQILMAPYDLGEVLVDRLYRDGGQAAVDAAFSDPPSTSEQLLDPAKYESHEARREVPAPPADGATIDQGVFGAFLLETLLTDAGVDAATARRAVDGWAGDRYVAWTAPGGGTCLRVDVATDSAADGQALAAALGRWRSSQAGATVEQPAADDVRLTSCTSVAA